MTLARRLLAPYLGAFTTFDRRIPIVSLAFFLFIAARMSVVTFLGIFFVEERGLAVTTVGLAFLVENLLRGVVAPFGGALSDRVGRRPVMIGAAVLTAATMPLFLLVRDPVTLLLWSAVVGVTQSGFFPSAMSLLFDLAPVARRQSALALNYTAVSLGYTLGVAPAGFLAEMGFHVLALWSAGAFVVVALLVVFLLRGEKPRDERPRESVLAGSVLAFRDPAFLAFAAVAVVFPLGLGLAALALPLFASDSGLTKSTIGLVLGVNGLLIAVLSIPANVVLERQGPYRHLAPAAVLFAAAYALLALPPGVAGITAAVAVFSLGEIVFSTAVPTAVAGLAPAGRRGAYQGAWGLLFSAALGGALYVSGIGRDTVGWSATWGIAAALTLAAAVAFVVARTRFRAVAEARAPST